MSKLVTIKRTETDFTVVEKIIDRDTYSVRVEHQELTDEYGPNFALNLSKEYKKIRGEMDWANRNSDTKYDLRLLDYADQMADALGWASEEPDLCRNCDNYVEYGDLCGIHAEAEERG